ncbi:Arc family DNA-binding protein [Streptomyces verrucosisporus]|uniref:TA system antitoxin ParD family protein n=1 Tax=Streptomyces verrucosisporus TaxID=1695161 RepID=UPI0019D1F896|nr:Arc family DNA-binding protein [Streptomyces verrucosisporus]MBN3931185.1 Arc family DNA-binding protein [Streptomyces verrucosisporus]
MVNFNVRFPDDLHARVRAQAAADRRSVNSEILHLIEVGLTAVAPETPDHPGGGPATPAPLCGKPDSPPQVGDTPTPM